MIAAWNGGVAARATEREAARDPREQGRGHGARGSRPVARPAPAASMGRPWPVFYASSRGRVERRPVVTPWAVETLPRRPHESGWRTQGVYAREASSVHGGKDFDGRDRLSPRPLPRRRGQNPVRGTTADSRVTAPERSCNTAPAVPDSWPATR